MLVPLRELVHRHRNSGLSDCHAASLELAFAVFFKGVEFADTHPASVRNAGLRPFSAAKRDDIGTFRARHIGRLLLSIRNAAINVSLLIRIPRGASDALLVLASSVFGSLLLRRRRAVYGRVKRLPHG